MLKIENLAQTHQRCTTIYTHLHTHEMKVIRIHASQSAREREKETKRMNDIG